MRNIDAEPVRGLDHCGAVRYLDYIAVYFKFCHGQIGSQIRGNQTLFVLDMMLKFVSKVLDERAYRHRCSIAERANGAPLYIVGDVVQQVEIFRLSGAAFDAVDHAIQPSCTLAARRALATGLLKIEIR